jgi:hypothetical protein
VPRSLRWSNTTRAKMVRTDVRRVSPRYAPQSGILGPGDDVVARAFHATIGIALRHPVLGPCVTTAAHLFEAAGPGAQVRISRDGTRQNVLATVRPITSFVDYALLRAAPGTPIANIYDDRVRLRGAFSPTDVDVGAAVFVLLSSGSLQRTVCRGIHAAIDTPEQVLEDCILTDMVTLGGDSGACLVDRQFRVWGALRGQLGRTFSVFAPVQHILDEERATLL